MPPALCVLSSLSGFSPRLCGLHYLRGKRLQPQAPHGDFFLKDGVTDSLSCMQGNKKLTKAATDLAALLKQQGKPEEAQKVAVEFDLQL